MILSLVVGAFFFGVAVGLTWMYLTMLRAIKEFDEFQKRKDLAKKLVRE